MKKLSQTEFISRKPLVQFSENSECGILTVEASPQQNLPGFVHAARSYAYVKITLLFFLFRENTSFRVVWILITVYTIDLKG